jgi:hypothetical protein
VTGPANEDSLPTPAAVSAVRVAASPEGKGWRLGVIGKRTWLVVRGHCEVAPLQVPLVETPLYDEKRAVLVHDADVILNRKRVDIVVEGHVYPPMGRTPFDCGVQVGKHLRTARAFGPRKVALDATTGKPRFSSPEPIEKIPLGWESAYGGVDLAARADIGDPFEDALVGAGVPADPRFGLFAYPRNPVGRGYLIEPTPAAIESCQLPLLEEPGAPLTLDNLVRKDFVHWPEGPPVVGFGWLAYTYFPRSALMGAPPLVYDGARISPSNFREVQSGDMHEAATRPDRPLTERLGIGVAQAAAIGMRADHVSPGDTVSAHGMHPRDLRWTFRLPSPGPKMYVRLPGERAKEMPSPSIRVLYLQPDEDRVTLVWIAELELPEPPGAKGLAELAHAVKWSD